MKRVHLIGRRGPIQASFTTAELREIVSLPNTTYVIAKQDLELNEASKKEMETQRAKKRMFELLGKKLEPVDDLMGYLNANPPSKKELVFHFFKSPVRIEKDRKLIMEQNELTGPADHQKAKGTGRFVTLPCGILFRSIGYKSVPVAGVPFDTKQGIVVHNQGKVENGLYVSGWLKRGPSGVIGTNRWDAEETVVKILEDVKSGVLVPKSSRSKVEYPSKAISFSDWKKVDDEEVKRGEAREKAREKIVSIDEMLKIAKT